MKLHRWICAGVAVAGLVLATLSPAAASTSWAPFRMLRLVVGDGVDPKGMVFAARGHFLVSPSTGGAYYLIAPKDLSVLRVPRSADARPDAIMAIDVDQTSGYESAGVLEKDGSILKWTDGGVRYALSAKPPMLGEVDLAALREYTSKYEAGIADYTPNADAVSALKAVSTPTEIVVGFGTWCPVCAEWLPRFIKTLEVASNPKIQARYISINEDLDAPADLMKKYALEGVPTFAVLRNDKEIGRVTGEELEAEPHPVLEQVLVRLVTGS